MTPDLTPHIPHIPRIQVRQHVAEGRYNEKYTRDSTCLVWMHRLLSGSCGARDQRLVLRLLFSSFAVITQSVYTFGFKMIYFKVRWDASRTPCPPPAPPLRAPPLSPPLLPPR